MDIKSQKHKYFEAFLSEVIFEGWSERAIENAAHTQNITRFDVKRWFEQDLESHAAYFANWADHEMITAFQKQASAKMKIREKIALAVRLRFEFLDPHKEALRKCAAFMAMPGNHGLALKAMFSTVNEMWYLAGDTSTDYNYYTKRGLLSIVQSSTALFWLNDQSENHQESWDFLERRISEVLKVGGTIGKLKNINLPPSLIPTPMGIFKKFREFQS